MAFMQRQITDKQSWLQVETTQGTEFVDAVSLGLNIRDSQTSTHPLSAVKRDAIVKVLQEYCDGQPQEWETIKGHGARLSAPGYMDCTDWAVFDTVEQAEAYLDEYYPEDEPEEPLNDACERLNG